MEQNKLKDGEDQARQFIQVNDFIEPYQKSFAALVIKICDYNNNLSPELKDPEARKKAEKERSSIGKAFSSMSSALTSRPNRSETWDLMNELMKMGQYRAVFALANTYSRKCDDNDEKIVALSQQAINQQKIKAKAQAIAVAALKAVQENLIQKKFWNAETEFIKAHETIQLRVTDPALLELVKIEMTKSGSEITGQQALARKKREALFELASRDALAGQKAFDEFIKQYSDYPNVDEDKLKISDIRASQVEKKFAAKLAAIEEVTQNDPQEAKVMIKKLEADVSTEDISVLKSRVTVLRRTILNRELAQIQDRMDEAQKFLEKVSVDYAMSIKKGTKPERSFIQKATTGTENLVRARSLQAGAVKQLEVLMQDPDLDLISKAKLTGLLESQKAALAQIDNDLSSKSSVFMGLGVVVLLIVVGVVVFIFIRKRGASSQPKVV